MTAPEPLAATDPASIRLTTLTHGGGCGCKIAPRVLREALAGVSGGFPHPDLLVGSATADDAAVFRLNDRQALVATTDFFMPIVDDPYEFGRIAATNALSDVYAMGGNPLMAVAILGWPIEKLGPELAQRVMDGARTTCREAGIPLAGGHSIDAPEPFFGLAVTGEVREDRIKRNHTAEPGDLLFLTKPIGVGILSTAQKRGVLSAEDAITMRDTMARSNELGAVLGQSPFVHAMTDVTGFGFLGHLLEMCGDRLSAHVQYEAVPKIHVAPALIANGCYPDGALRNWKSYGHRVQGAGTMERMFMLADPQTSGGLLIAVDPAQRTWLEELLRSEGLPNTCFGHFENGSISIPVIVT